MNNQIEQNEIIYIDDHYKCCNCDFTARFTYDFEIHLKFECTVSMHNLIYYHQ